MRGPYSTPITPLTGSLFHADPQSNGKKLGDGTKDDVLDTVHGLEAQAEDMLIKARWMRLIVAGMKGKKTVRQTYDDAAVKALQLKAQAQ